MSKFLALLCLFVSASAFADIIDTKHGPRGTGYLGHTLSAPALTYEAMEVRADLPESYDLRETGKLPGIRNQGSCGSCWAFAITKSLEATEALKGGKVGFDLAEQELVSCNRTAYGCGGGFMESAQYVVDHGLALEADFPYRAADVRCKQGPVASKAVSYKLIGSAGKAPTPAEIKTAIFERGVVFVTVAAGNGWDGNGPELKYCRNRGTNHMVNLVGWTKDNKWIMANSWSDTWGDKGYALVPFGCDRIGEEAGFVTIE